ncbi:MAG: MarR family transcriptional regulator, partial [Gemmatimonadaceae bacterium]
VDRLVKKRLVQRFRDPNDQRRALVVITKSGEAILHELSLFHQAELRSQASALIASMTAIVRGASV